MDKYDKAIAHLLESNEFEIAANVAWNNPETSIAGCLFQVVNSTGNRSTLSNVERYCGCLTEIRAGFLKACTNELTQRIQADIRLPSDVRDISKKNLCVFAEWQRELDRTIRNK